MWEWNQSKKKKKAKMIKTEISHYLTNGMGKKYLEFLMLYNVYDRCLEVAAQIDFEGF